MAKDTRNSLIAIDNVVEKDGAAFAFGVTQQGDKAYISVVALEKMDELLGQTTEKGDVFLVSLRPNPVEEKRTAIKYAVAKVLKRADKAEFVAQVPAKSAAKPAPETKTVVGPMQKAANNILRAIKDRIPTPQANDIAMTLMANGLDAGTPAFNAAFNAAQTRAAELQCEIACQLFVEMFSDPAVIVEMVLGTVPDTLGVGISQVIPSTSAEESAAEADSAAA
jgi:hypothetical protein